MVDKSISHVPGEHRKNLGASIDGQPQPEHLFGAAQPGVEFVQLEMWEVQIAEGALVQRLRVLASTSQPPRAGGLTGAKDTLSRRSIQPSARTDSTMETW